MKKLLVILVSVIAIITVAIVVTGGPDTKSNKKSDKPAKKIKAKAHVVTAKQKKEILKDTRKAVELLQESNDSTEALDSFLANPVLIQMVRQIENDKRMGRRKIKIMSDVELVLKNITSGIAGVTLTYIDDSYYVDWETGRTLSKPTGAKERRALALRRHRGKWKIFESFSEELKEDAPMPPSEPNKDNESI